MTLATEPAFAASKASCSIAKRSSRAFLSAPTARSSAVPGVASAALARSANAPAS